MEKLKQVIIKNAFNTDEIQQVIRNSVHSSNKSNWIFNFKVISLNQEFLTLFCEEFSRIYSKENIQVGGMESGALPFLTALVLSNKNVVQSFYVRKSRKKSDLANLFEGKIDKDIPIVLVDDILNTGSTFLKQISILETEGYKVSSVFSIIKYRDTSFYKAIENRGIKINYFFELDDFNKDLGLSNINTIDEARFSFDKFTRVWGVQLPHHKTNMYAVAPKSGLCDDDTILFTGADDGTFYAINKSDGGIKWQYKVRFGVQGKNIFSTPCISEKYVFFGAYDGNLYCLDKETGKMVWIFFDGDYIGSSPCVEKNKYVYIGLEFGLFNKRGGVAKISIETGKLVWGNYEMIGFTHASPVFNERFNIVVCGCNDHYIYCFDSKTGKLNWKYKTGGEVKYGVVFDEKRGLVIVASMDGGVYCLYIKSGILFHKFEAMFGFYSTPEMDKDHIYIGSLDKRVYCFSLKDKNKKWEVVTGGRIFASPVLFKDCIYIGSNDGNLYEIHKENGEVISRTIISERIVNKILVQQEDGATKLYVKSFTGQLYKFQNSINQ